MEDLQISPGIWVPANMIGVAAVRSSGPGGQNVNKVSSKVQLHVHPSAVVGLDAGQYARLLVGAASLIATDGSIMIQAQHHRDRLANLDAALTRLRRLIEGCLVAPRPRRPTRPSRGSIERRLREKRQRSDTRRARGIPKD